MLFQGKPGPAGPLGSSGTIGAPVSELFPSAIEFTVTSYFRRQFVFKISGIFFFKQISIFLWLLYFCHISNSFGTVSLSS